MFPCYNLWKQQSVRCLIFSGVIVVEPAYHCTSLIWLFKIRRSLIYGIVSNIFLQVQIGVISGSMFY